MASYIDMSLDDIIQKNKRENLRPKSKIKSQFTNNKQDVIDARNKIIFKKRTQIMDAREKLAQIAKQKDARLKLEQLRAKKAKVKIPGGNTQYHQKFIYHNHQSRRDRDPSRHVVSQPLAVKSWKKQNFVNNKFVVNRSIEPRVVSKPMLKPIIRTIENDLEIIDDPMKDSSYEDTRTITNRKASLQLKIVTHNINAFRSATVEKEQSPPRPPSILKKRPMAALRSENKVEKTEKEKPAQEFRIIVSNLRTSVTAGDIEELFGDVGGMQESRLVRPGTAEVIYETLEDAQRAVELYHNRQLDKQPMNCLLVTPRTTPVPSSSSNKPALYSTNSNVEPDTSTFHKVLFSDF